MIDKKSREATLDMLSFIDTSPTAAHATTESVRRLEAEGFKCLDEADRWDIKPGDRFYVTRNNSSIIAVRVGTAPVEDAGFRIAGAHTDFPGLRLKPNGVYSKNGYIQLGVEVYGGPILHTWLDRDLGLAGKLVVREKDGSHRIVLFAVNRPVCRIPNIAPHIRVNKKEEIKFNEQDHIPPVIGLGDSDILEEKPILKLIADAAEGGGVDPERVSGYSIEVFDLQPGTLGGMNDEFVFVRAIDNLASCHAGIVALKNAPKKTPFTQVLALFDNEEVGSRTMQGAGSGFLDTVLERICLPADHPREAYFRSIASSFIISVDGAHAVNPNYPEAHEPRHHPVLNGGPVIKVNANERYTTQTDALTHLRKCAENAGRKGGSKKKSKSPVPLQTFVARTDVGTGSTIGPMTACRLGMRSIDIGTPMISMHSSREMGGTADQLYMIKLLTEHFS